MELDATDGKILNLLQQDGRMTNAKLAERINLSASACLRRVRRLEDAGVITGYAALVDPGAVGRSTSVFVEVTVGSQSEDSLEAFEQAVQGCADVMECYLMSGEADYLIRVVAADSTDFERVHKTLTRLPGLARTRSSFVLRTICKKTAYEV